MHLLHPFIISIKSDCLNNQLHDKDKCPSRFLSTFPECLQVRRIVGTLVAVGKGKIGEEDVKALIDVASSDAWPSNIITAPPDGLYLVNVEYDPVSFETGWSPKYGVPMNGNMGEESDEPDLEDEESPER